MTTAPRSLDATDDPFSRHGLGKRDQTQAVPATAPWHLGGNTGIITEASNFLGTINVVPLIFKTAQAAGSLTEHARITAPHDLGMVEHKVCPVFCPVFSS